MFDKNLHLVCWNRQFGELLRIAAAADPRWDPARSISCGSTPSTAPPTESEADVLVRERLARYVASSEPFLRAVRRARSGYGSACQPDAGRRHRHDLHRHHPSVKAAEELERANESLERRVRERTEELTRLNTELGRAKGEADQANISKTRFLAAASHDILQPLNAARLYVTSLVERHGGGNDSQLVGNIDASLDAVEEISGRCSTFRVSIPAL